MPFEDSGEHRLVLDEVDLLVEALDLSVLGGAELVALLDEHLYMLLGLGRSSHRQISIRQDHGQHAVEHPHDGHLLCDIQLRARARHLHRLSELVERFIQVAYEFLRDTVAVVDDAVLASDAEHILLIVLLANEARPQTWVRVDAAQLPEMGWHEVHLVGDVVFFQPPPHTQHALKEADERALGHA